MQRQLAALVAACALLCAACGGSAAPTPKPAAPSAKPAASAPAAPASTPSPAPAKSKPFPIRFSFSFIPTGNQAPYYAALDRGYYKAQGLAVTLIKGVTPQQSINALTSGHTDIGESDTSYAVDLMTKGAPLKIVAITFQQDPLGLVYLKSAPINKPTDLYGKTVGTFAGSEAEILYKVFVQTNKLDASKIKLVDISPQAAVGLLGQHKVDVFTGGGYTFGPGAAAHGLQLGTMLFGHYGVQVLANCIVTTDKMLSQHPAAVRKFLLATAEGFAFAQAHPNQAAQYQSKAIGVSAKILEGSLTQSLQFLHAADTRNKPWGWSSPQDWQHHLQLMHQSMGLKSPKAPSAYYTNAYLPTGPVSAP